MVAVGVPDRESGVSQRNGHRLGRRLKWAVGNISEGRVYTKGYYPQVIEVG